MAKRIKNSPPITHTESVEEFLARGGKIKKLETIQDEKKDVSVRSTTVGPANMMSKASIPHDISISKESLKEIISTLNKLSDKEKEQILDMADNMSELSFQAPNLEETALMYGEKVSRNKKEKFIDKNTINNIIDTLSNLNMDADGEKWLKDFLAGKK